MLEELHANQEGSWQHTMNEVQTQNLLKIVVGSSITSQRSTPASHKLDVKRLI